MNDFTIIGDIYNQSPLTLDKLAEVIDHLIPKVYYIPSRYCPKTDEEGKTVLFKMALEEHTVWVIHPDFVPPITAMLHKRGVQFIRYSIGKLPHTLWHPFDKH